MIPENQKELEELKVTEAQLQRQLDLAKAQDRANGVLQSIRSTQQAMEEVPMRIPAPTIGAFELDEPIKEDLHIKFKPNQLTKLHSLRSSALSELKSSEEKRLTLELEQQRIIEQMATCDTEIYALRDTIQRIDAVCERD
jgi:hypothetical protein